MNPHHVFESSFYNRLSAIGLRIPQTLLSPQPPPQKDKNVFLLSLKRKHMYLCGFLLFFYGLICQFLTLTCQIRRNHVSKMYVFYTFDICEMFKISI